MNASESSSGEDSESSSSSSFHEKKIKPLIVNDGNIPYRFSIIKQNSIFQTKVKN